MLWIISKSISLHSFRLNTLKNLTILNHCYVGKDGSRRGCCRGQTFDLNGHLECCEGNNLVPVGTCLGETTIHESYGKSPFEV